MGRNYEDEFNKLKVTNERDVLKNEFFQNKDVEYVKTQENIVPKDEFTSKDKGSLHTKNNENLNKFTEKALESNGEVVTVTSSTTASTIAATSTTVVAAASTVAIVAIGTVTGISIDESGNNCKYIDNG